MGKKKNERVLPDHASKAILRNARVSPTKANLIARLIRGQTVDKAMDLLFSSKKRFASEVRCLLLSAISNAENNQGLDIDELIVKEAFVGKGMVMKRWHARARGRGGKIFKPFSHFTVVVSQEERGAA